MTTNESPFKSALLRRFDVRLGILAEDRDDSAMRGHTLRVKPVDSYCLLEREDAMQDYDEMVVDESAVDDLRDDL